MRATIKAGTILIREGTSLPDSLKFEGEPYSLGWRSITAPDGFAMDRKAHDAGWTFFYLAGEGRATAFGGGGQETVRRAIKRILAGMKFEKFNSVEITRVAFKHLFGVPYAIVSFHRRNMQKGMFLAGSENARAWKDATFVAA